MQTACPKLNCIGILLLHDATTYQCTRCHTLYSIAQIAAMEPMPLSSLDEAPRIASDMDDLGDIHEKRKDTTMAKDKALFNLDRLQTARKEAGLSQAQAAFLMQMARTTMVAIEKGERKLTHSELDQFAKIYGVEVEWLQGAAEVHPVAIHIYLGFSAGTPEPGERCFYCGSRPDRMAYTYFGAPVCRECWDTKWRETEDGQTDPPFDDIKNAASGYWV